VGVVGLVLSAVILAGCQQQRPWDSVLLIVVDTLRADHLGVYGHSRETSPNIDRWSEDAAIFETAVATSPWTLPTFGTLLTGELPSLHRAGFHRMVDGQRVFTVLASDVPTIPETLAQRDIATAAVMNNPFLHPRFGIARGFDTYDYVPGNNVEIRRADDVVDAAVGWLDDHDADPFLLLVHLFDAHLSYDPPHPFRGKFTGDPEAEGYRDVRVREIRPMLRRGEAVDFEFLEAAYDEEIAFVDSEVGRLLDAVQRRGIGERTLVLLTADHGEEFLDHGGFEHGHTMYQELIRVPLLAWGPGVVPRRIQEPVSLLDVPATILEGLGVETFTALPGVSLLAALEGGSSPASRPLVAEAPKYGADRSAVVQWPLKLVRGPRDDVHLFDLVSDPAESVNLAAERPRDVERMSRTLEAIQLSQAAGSEYEPVELDPETLKQLRSLGYVR
jgi:arylsulfatase A-like enzyme